MATIASNRGVVYQGPGKVAVQKIAPPTLDLAEQNRRCQHGVILKASRRAPSLLQGGVAPV